MQCVMLVVCIVSHTVVAVQLFNPMPATSPLRLPLFTIHCTLIMSCFSSASC